MKTIRTDAFAIGVIDMTAAIAHFEGSVTLHPYRAGRSSWAVFYLPAAGQRDAAPFLRQTGRVQNRPGDV